MIVHEQAQRERPQEFDVLEAAAEKALGPNGEALVRRAVCDTLIPLALEKKA